MRAGAKFKRPLYILGGVLVGLIGLPLGAWGVGALVGILSGLAGLLIAYYAVAGSTLLAGGAFMLLGLIRMSAPGIWDKLLAVGAIQINGPLEFLNQLPPVIEGLLLMVAASVLIATGVGMLWLGKRMLRGLRFLYVVIAGKLGQLARRVRARLRRGGDGFGVGETVNAAK